MKLLDNGQVLILVHYWQNFKKKTNRYLYKLGFVNKHCQQDPHELADDHAQRLENPQDALFPVLQPEMKMDLFSKCQ